jgi:hypothetical protein
MAEVVKMVKVEKLQQQQDTALEKYRSTKDTKHLKTIYKCIEERDKLLLSKIKEIKAKL